MTVIPNFRSQINSPPPSHFLQSLVKHSVHLCLFACFCCYPCLLFCTIIQSGVFHSPPSGSAPHQIPVQFFSPLAFSCHQKYAIVFERVHQVILLTIEGCGGGKVLRPVINLQGRENTPSLQGYSIETYSLLLRVNEGPLHLSPSLYIIDTTP